MMTIKHGLTTKLEYFWCHQQFPSKKLPHFDVRSVSGTIWLMKTSWGKALASLAAETGVILAVPELNLISWLIINFIRKGIEKNGTMSQIWFFFKISVQGVLHTSTLFSNSKISEFDVRGGGGQHYGSSWTEFDFIKSQNP